MISAPATLPSRYQLKEVIGEGGMGRVYRAHDAQLARDVAIKVIEAQALPGKDHTQQRERFVREARAAARLAHPNIVAVHDVDPDAGWLVMALIDGTTLRDISLPATPALVRTIAAQALSALSAAHAAGVVHRDIKPSNIVLGETTGRAPHITLVDFGVARLLDGELTKTGESLGTPAYMAPEQMRGAAVDARTDLYGLGATLFELVTGEKMIAFESPGPHAIAKVRTACGDDVRLATLIERCLQAEPLARWQTAEGALAALTSRRRSSRARVIALAAAAIAVVIVAAWFALRGSPEPDPRLAQAFQRSQRGEHETAGQQVDSYLADHPDDPDALTLRFLIAWWQGGSIEEPARRAGDARLRPEQRALVHGIDLISKRRESEAAGVLANAEREHPAAAEILFALGEAQWHARQYEAGVATLTRAFHLDPRWQMALHHVVEYRLARGETAHLVPIATRLHQIDTAAATALECGISIGKRTYKEGAAIARAGIAKQPTAELYICLSQALALLDDLDGGEAAAKKAFELWPVDLREWGGFAHRTEYLLYRGQLDQYVALIGQKPSRQRSLALSLWRPDPSIVETSPMGPGMRMPPLGAATFVLVGHAQKRDEVATYGEYPETEVREYGKGLWAETRKNPQAAIAHYRRALATPSKGDIRMLIAHHLARTLISAGDAAGAKAACREVIQPTLYQAYRAVLLPDCLAWSGEASRLSQLWRDATFQHPALAP